MYFQHSMLIPQMGSDFPRKGCPNVHDWGQVCMFQGENGQGFGAFTTITADIYAHVLPEMQQEVVKRLDDLYGGS